MLFGAWAKNEPIPITSHSFDDFKEFLTFFYLGQCNINMENVMAIVDLAESYNVQILKEKCDQFLTNAKPTVENVFNICELLKTYSLQNALTNLYEFVAINAATLLMSQSQSFLETKKDIVMDIVKMERLVIKEEDLFKSVYKWAEYQSQKDEKENPSWIKEDPLELSDILPHIRFPIMNIEFLHSDVVPLGYLFSSFTELSLILRDADVFQKTKTVAQPVSKYLHTFRKSFNLEFTDNKGNVAHAYLQDLEFIERLNNENRNYSRCHYDLWLSNAFYNGNGVYISNECFWQIDVPNSVKNDVLFDLNLCKIYVIRNNQGKLGLKDFSIKSDEISNPRMARMSQRFLRNFDAYAPQNPGRDSFEGETIARVFCENENFNAGQGCNLKVI
uniref:BACK domain-containing protein n=1 Tax=Panagrolaimus sp. PS1159 TaxID=55785 RepID=A0AC35FT31_9BILA